MLLLSLILPLLIEDFRLSTRLDMWISYRGYHDEFYIPLDRITEWRLRYIQKM